MCIGIPNVGKSSLINAMRNVVLKKKSAALTGNKPGVTKTVMERIKIADVPPIYLLDTPGVFPPEVPDFETGMKLGLCHTILDHLVGKELL